MRASIAICLLSFFSLNIVLSQCDPVQDSLTLVALYNKTDGPNWSDNTNWLVPGQPISTWYGVVEVDAEGCVTCLDLDGDEDCFGGFFPGNNLKGTIPPEIGDLTELIFLALTADSLTGGIPPEIGKLSKLKTLYLYRNGLTDPIPKEIGDLTNLVYLDLHSNDIGGAIPNEFGNLVNLQELNLNRNNISGAFPPEFGDLDSLRALYILGNPIEVIPPEFGNLKSLETIVFTESGIKKIPPEFGNLPKLRSITWQNGQLENLPPELGNIDSLGTLFMPSNKISGHIPPELGNLKKLWTLNLNRNNLSGPIPPELGNATEFGGSLDLSYNNLTGPIPPELGNMKNIFFLNLQSNDLSGPIPPELGNFEKIVILDLSNNQLSEAIPLELANLTTLSRLEMSNNNLEGSIPSVLGDSLTNLFGLDLSHNNLVGAIPSSIASMTKLNDLHLSHNQLSGNLPVELLSHEFDDLSLHFNNYSFQFVNEVLTIPVTGELFIWPQNDIPFDSTFYVQPGETIIIDLGVDENIPDNNYAWKKNGSNWTPDPINDPNSNQLIIPDIQVSDAGFYRAFITNPNYFGITLRSVPIHVQVCESSADSMQLEELYISTEGDNWSISTNWFEPNMPIGSWHGITTDAFGCVNKIDLNDNNLDGSLPALDLNTLDTLILTHNAITGDIPDLQTPFIKYLDLSENGFSGSIPELNIPLIEHLNLSVNTLGGSIPQSIGQWMGLRVIDFSHNTIGDLIPPDIGDLCEAEELRLNDNDFTGELPVELTKLLNLQFGQVDFSNNQIDSLQAKIAFFCPFGDTILQNNPSYDRFLNICNVQCTGDEWDNLEDFPWVTDTLEGIPCPDTLCKQYFAESGFVDVRGIKVMFTRTVCVTDFIPMFLFEEDVLFYDCGGNLLETAFCDQDNFCTDFGAISEFEFRNLDYDVRWRCGDTIPLINSVDEAIFDKQFSSVPLTVFPNPTNSEIQFINQPDMDFSRLRCTNIWGKEVAVDFSEGPDLTKLKIPGDASGMYLLSIPGKGRVYVAKIVIQK